ncbi:nitrous oxide reductase accessory protein NosL [Ralstonia sp. UBA689]|uniref:nitrous oxide reductase accessory protein NosL n=1 Tax=Ralstonia sp. UBA689 TaxID=1947373 RepID=UPI0025FE3DF5|nr:nitrous oxide reductase accessory protein NosL [Ralstonia sp. UBA689]
MLDILALAGAATADGFGHATPMVSSFRFLLVGEPHLLASHGAFTCDSPLSSSVQNRLCPRHQRRWMERVMTTRRPMLALAALLATLWSLWWFVGRADRRAEPQLPEEICFVAPAVPYDPRSGLHPHAPRPIPASARCPVCGVFPSRAPEWAAQLIFANGDAYFFDSPMSLFIYLRNLQRYAPGRQAAEVAASYVHATGDGGWVPAQQAVYVWGSAVLGPMRRGNLPAFRNLADAQQFIARNGGVVVRPADITAERLQDFEPHRVHRAADRG